MYISFRQVFSDYHDRLVEFSPPLNWYVDESNVAVCRLGDDVEPSAFDWVGVFKVTINDVAGPGLSLNT